MRQLFLATALVALPVAAFTGFNIYVAKAHAGRSMAVAGLGDLSSLAAIIADVKSAADAGDLAAAKTRIKDFEIAWDENEKGLKPKDPATWAQIDDAADEALTSVRATTPDPTVVSQTLVALQDLLQRK